MRCNNWIGNLCSANGEEFVPKKIKINIFGGERRNENSAEVEDILSDYMDN